MYLFNFTVAGDHLSGSETRVKISLAVASMRATNTYTNYGFVRWTLTTCGFDLSGMFKGKWKNGSDDYWDSVICCRM